MLPTETAKDLLEKATDNLTAIEMGLYDLKPAIKDLNSRHVINDILADLYNAKKAMERADRKCDLLNRKEGV